MRGLQARGGKGGGEEVNAETGLCFLEPTWTGSKTKTALQGGGGLGTAVNGSDRALGSTVQVGEVAAGVRVHAHGI